LEPKYFSVEFAHRIYLASKQNHPRHFHRGPPYFDGCFNFIAPFGVFENSTPDRRDGFQTNQLTPSDSVLRVQGAAICRSNATPRNIAMKFKLRHYQPPV